MSILPFLKPVTLESISLFDEEEYDQTMEHIVNLEQWKQAKYLETNHYNHLVSVEQFFHFDIFDIYLQSISPQEMTKIRDVLMKSPNFDFAFIWLCEDYNENDMERIFESDIPRAPDDSINYKVPDSENVFRVFIGSKLIKIEKIAP